jgi:hypothetical protein
MVWPSPGGRGRTCRAQPVDIVGIASEKLHYLPRQFNQAGNPFVADAHTMERLARCDAFLKEVLDVCIMQCCKGKRHQNPRKWVS